MTTQHTATPPHELETLENDDIDTFAENFDELVAVLEARYDLDVEIKEMVDGRDFAVASAKVITHADSEHAQSIGIELAENYEKNYRNITGVYEIETEVIPR